MFSTLEYAKKRKLTSIEIRCRSKIDVSFDIPLVNENVDEEGQSHRNDMRRKQRLRVQP